MKKGLLLVALTAVAAALVALPAAAQITANVLPGGEGLPGAWNPAAALAPSPEKWAASVSWQVTNPAADLYTYWYKVDHLGAGPLSPPTQPLKSATLDLLPVNVQQIAGVYQFGQYETAGQSWAAEIVQGTDSTLRWSHYSGVYDQLFSGETIYLWVRSELPPKTFVNFTLQDGTIAQTDVPAPGPIPEPMTMALAGMGLASVAGLRTRLLRKA